MTTTRTLWVKLELLADDPAVIEEAISQLELQLDIGTIQELLTDVVDVEVTNASVEVSGP
ncbi:MAG: hypothetical protein KA310_03175 [Pseudomonadales bacterium]|nr:hypothetical protein [Pseudomonadales bacterium]